MRKFLMVLGLVLLAGAARADALCDCRADCSAKANPAEGKAYDDEEHRLWYEVRFWAGKCEGKIWLTCWSGPSWYELMDFVLAKATTQDRPDMCRRLYRIGVDMGFEWAKDNAIRTIHTSDLEDWKALLLEDDDPIRAVKRIESLVAARLE